MTQELEQSSEKSSPDKPSLRSGGSVTWAVAIATVLIVALLVGAYLVSRVLDVTEGVLSLPERAAQGLEKIFKAEVTVESDSFVLADQSIAELAVLERQVVTTTKYESSFFGVKATAIIKGVYRVKAGYDLTKPYSFSIDEETGIVEATLPEAEILSIETESQEVFYLSENMINSIDSQEWQNAYRENRLAAEQEAKGLGLLEETRERFLERAKDLLNAQGMEISLPAF